MPRKTWFLVADAARAQIFECEAPGGRIHPVNAHIYAAPTRNRSRSAGTDRPGVGRDRMGFGRHALQPEMDWQTHEKTMFAKRLGHTLRSAAEAHAFDDLVLVAPPWMLGRLRTALDNDVRRHVRDEIAKDLTHLSPHLIAQRLTLE